MMQSEKGKNSNQIWIGSGPALTLGLQELHHLGQPQALIET